MKMTIAVLSFIAIPLYAQTIYKCEHEDGGVSYSQMQCPKGKITVIRPDAGPSKADQQRAQRQVDAEIARRNEQEAAVARLQQQKHAEDTRLFATKPNAPALPQQERRLVHTETGWDRMTSDERVAYENRKAAQAAAAAAAAANSSKSSSSTDAGAWDWKTGRFCTTTGGSMSCI